MSMTDPLIGQQLGDYKIEGVLGTGGMARVYRGRDENLDRYAAIKVIEPQLIASADEDEYRERFLREARAIARLNHPRIVSVYQFNQVGNLYYIAMEYVEGRNLREILKEHIKKDELIGKDALLKILNDIADALDYAHKQSIIHRDVKPSNIIVTSEGNAVLTDFGLALNAVEGTIGNTFGSVHYIAPEQAISSAQAVPQSDQYSLGIVTYEMLTGRVPFDDASAMSVALKHISDPPPPPTDLNPNIPAEVEQVILKSLNKEVNDRYSTSREFVKALEDGFEMADISKIAPPPDLTSEALKPPPPRPITADEADDDAPTRRGTPDSVSAAAEKISAAKKGTQTPAPAGAQNRWWLWGAVVLFLIIAGIIGFALRASGANVAATETAIAAVETRSDHQTATTAAGLVLSASQTNEAATAIAAVEASRAAAEATETLRAAASDTASAQLSAATATASATSTATASPTRTTTATATQTASPTRTTTATPAPTDTPQPTATPANTRPPTSTPRPSETPTPDVIMGADAAAPQILLRYDGRMIVIGNRDPNETLDISDLQFVLFAPNDDGQLRREATFDISNERFEDAADRLNPERCLQILDGTLFRTLPQENPLANDLCGGRPFWVTTTDPFWVSRSAAEAYFEVRLGPVDVLTRCPVNVPQTRIELRCAVDLNLLAD